MAKLDYEKLLNKPSLKEAAKRSKKISNVSYDAFTIPEQVKDYGLNKLFYVRTYGCQANVRDGETIIGILQNMGYSQTEDMAIADIVILNTCAIRENAEEKVFGEIGHLKAFKKAKKDSIYAICGCMVQQEKIVQAIYEKYPQIDLVFGTHNIHRLPQLINEVISKQNRIIEVFSYEGEVIENMPVSRQDKLKAWVNIMYGCDKFCTYCIVPYTRGQQRSRRKKDILIEVEDLIKQGYKEITLLGQNVNAYGKDLVNQEDGDFADLLEAVANTSIPRIRFVTSHPWDFNPRMIEMIAKYHNLMPFIHLPVQSGDDQILKKMGRRYDVASYLKLYNAIRSIEGVSITTDIIVGFPKESEEAFNNTLALVDACQFDSAFTFIYSPREGTPASKMEDDITLTLKHQRFDALVKKINDYALMRNKLYQGKIIKVLVEGTSKKNNNILSGYSESNKLVNFKGSIDLIGQIVNVKITKAKTFTLEGEVCE